MWILSFAMSVVLSKQILCVYVYMVSSNQNYITILRRQWRKAISLSFPDVTLPSKDLSSEVSQRELNKNNISSKMFVLKKESPY